MKGLSASNLKYMRFFAQECPELKIGQQSADQLPWFHIVTLITKLTVPAIREWYSDSIDSNTSVISRQETAFFPNAPLRVPLETLPYALSIHQGIDRGARSWLNFTG